MDFNYFFYIKNLEYYTNYEKISNNINVGNIPIDVIKNESLHFKKHRKYYIKYDNKYYLVNNISTKNKDIIIKTSGVNNNNPIFKNIFVRSDILNILKNKEIKEKYIGIHFRNTDIQTDINTVFANIKSILKKQNDIYVIFLATDDYSSVKKFQEKFKDKKIINFCKIKETSINNIHYLKDDVLKKNNTSKKEQILDILTDIYLLTKSTKFIGNKKSGVSKCVYGIRNGKYNNIFQE
tara:strand:- start:1682 stop:2392 length:711 start_codon:yes stop_codon:yes gene_type:complete